MRRKNLLTAGLCAVLSIASLMVGSTCQHISVVSPISVQAEEAAQAGEMLAAETVPETSEPKTSAPETQAPETSAPETQAPETQAPETSAPETSAPETQPPETSAPETQAPETSAPETQAPEPDTTVPETPGTETSAPETPGTETQAPETTPPETEIPTEGQTDPSPEQTEEPSEEETENGLGLLSKDKEDPDEDIEEEELKDAEKSPYSSNEELLAHQHIVVPDIQLEFRFTQVDARYGVVRNKEGASVYESKSEDARQVGALAYYGCVYILEDAGDGWYYIESGNVRGFLKSEEVVTDETARRIVDIKGLDQLSVARLLVARNENDAFDYTHTTVQEVIAPKVYAVASGSVNIYEQRKTSSRVTGVLSDRALCYVLADEDKEWIYVESGNARGFVQKSQLILGAAADQKVSETGENNMALADVQVNPENNSACYYTLTSVKEASQSAMTREAIVNFALQFVGNPYVWGGTSLTNGADCSGFVQSVYANFGYSLPRVAADQSGYGMQIPISSAQPGDLIFYASNGYVYHVSMYIGDGQVVHASSSRTGIIVSGINGNAVWATRIVSD